MVLMNCEEIDFIESFYRSFSKSERSGLAYFHIFLCKSSIEVLPKCIASCCFSEVIVVLFSNLNGVDSFLSSAMVCFRPCVCLSQSLLWQ